MNRGRARHQLVQDAGEFEPGGAAEEGDVLQERVSPGRYAVVYCELTGPGRFYTHASELAPSEEGFPLVVTNEEVAVLQEEILPYWEREQCHAAYMKALPEGARKLMERLFVVTPAATSRSLLAWAHDYGKVLGLAGAHRSGARPRRTSPRWTDSTSPGRSRSGRFSKR